MSKTKYNKTEKLFPFQSNFIFLVKGKMHFIDLGHGEPILFLHGNPTWSYIYRHFFAPLSQKYRVVALDHLGFGLSDKPADAPYSLQWHMQNLEEFILHKNLEEITLVVHDWGGPIGLGVAVEFPQRFKRLVILNSWGFLPPADVQLPLILECIQRESLGERLVLEQNILVEMGIPNGIHRKEQVTEELMEAYRGPFPDRNSRRAMLALVRDIPSKIQPPSVSIFKRLEIRLPELRIPTAIIWGEKDTVFPLAFIQRWQNVFPHADLFRIRDGAHFLQEDAPHAILARMQQFLAQHP